jgi:hypothetical protein
MSEYVNFYIGNKKPKEEKFKTFCYTGDSYSRGSIISQTFKEVLGYNTDEDELALPVTVENLKDIITNLKAQLERNKKYQEEFKDREKLLNDIYSQFEKTVKDVFDKNKDKDDIHIEIEKSIYDSISKVSEDLATNDEYIEELKETEEAIIDAISFYEHYLYRIEYSDTVGLFAGVEAINPDGSMDDFE